MRGMFLPPQPVLNRDAHLERYQSFAGRSMVYSDTLKTKSLVTRTTEMEYPFFGEPIFEEPLVGFVRGNDPIFDRFKEIIGPHHFTPWEIMRWQAEKNGVKPPRSGRSQCGFFCYAVFAQKPNVIMPPPLNGHRRDGRRRAFWVKSSARRLCVKL